MIKQRVHAFMNRQIPRGIVNLNFHLIACLHIVKHKIFD